MFIANSINLKAKTHDCSQFSTGYIKDFFPHLFAYLSCHRIKHFLSHIEITFAAFKHFETWRPPAKFHQSCSEMYPEHQVVSQISRSFHPAPQSFSPTHELLRYVVSQIGGLQGMSHTPKMKVKVPRAVQWTSLLEKGRIC